MSINFDTVQRLTKEYGDAFYLLDMDQFKKNWTELQTAFRKYYSNTCIAYSYKTNYIPQLCQLAYQLGGYAEVVSDMEYEITKRLGIDAKYVIFNGPYKNAVAVKDVLLKGGLVNLDSVEEVDLVCEFAKLNPTNNLRVGIRCNFNVNDGVTSRFGFDVTDAIFTQSINTLRKYDNIKIEGLHCHFAARNLDTWAPRAEGMSALVTEYFDGKIGSIDLGGGIFGKMKESLVKQFNSYVPNYEEYAKEAASIIARNFSSQDAEAPMLFIEPGSALSGDVMQFVSQVVSIKTIRGKHIATLLGSIYNINPTLNKKNPPISVLKSATKHSDYVDLDFGGFTCIESDYLYRGYNGELAKGDYVVFDNVGSYSVVLKPPFILPNFPILVLDDTAENGVRVVKRQETFDDLFRTYIF